MTDTITETTNATNESAPPEEQGQIADASKNPLARNLSYSFTTGEIDPLLVNRLSQLGRTSRVNGFRPGKVPIKVLHDRWGAQCLREILADKADEKFTQESADLPERPASRPNFTLATAKPGEYRVDGIYEIIPEIGAPDFSKEELRRPVLEVGDSEIDEMIERLRRDHGTEIIAQRAALKTDSIMVDFIATKDGEKQDEGKNRRWNLAAPQLPEEITSQLVGASAGEQRSITIKHPDDHPEEKLRGTETQLAVTVISVNELQLPELNDEFFKRFNISEGGADAFRDLVGKQLRTEVSSRLKNAMREQSMNALITATPHFELPQTMLQNEFVALYRQMQDESKKLGLPSVPNNAEQRLVSEASRRVALGLIMAAWQEREKPEISEETMNTRLNELAEGYESPDAFKSRIRSDDNSMNALRLSLLEERVAEWVCSQAKITDEKITLSQLLGNTGG